MERPWQSAVPDLCAGVTEVVEFPTDEEDDGIARMVWRGPSVQVREDTCHGEYNSLLLLFVCFVCLFVF